MVYTLQFSVFSNTKNSNFHPQSWISYLKVCRDTKTIYIFEQSLPTWFQWFYFKVPNNSAANLILFLENSILHGLIPSCTFINFGKFQAKTFIFTNKKWKIPTCTALFQPARLLIFGILPACTFIPSCTIIRYTKVGVKS